MSKVMGAENEEIYAKESFFRLFLEKEAFQSRSPHHFKGLHTSAQVHAPYTVGISWDMYVV